MRRTGLIFFVILILSNLLLAGTTGKLTGSVIDETTGEPLIGCSVLIQESFLGAATDNNGRFVILNIPPGKYSVAAQMIGYQKKVMKEVSISVDQTTTINFELGTETLKGEEVTVIATRDVVKKDVTSTTATVDADKIATLPVTDLNEIVEMQAGMVDGHMRGGRSGEVQYVIDGMSVSDVYDGGQLVTVSKDQIQEIQVISGAFNAEYGQAMSGIVNVTTKSNFPNWGGQLTLYSGDFISGNSDIFLGLDDFNPLATKNLDFSFHGPIIKNKLSFSFNTRQVYWEGYLNGRDRFNPWNVAGVVQTTPGDYMLFSLGDDPSIDSLVVYSYLEEGQDFDSLYNHYRSIHEDPTGNDKIVPMQWNENHYYNGLLGWNISNRMELTLQGSYRDYTWQDYDRMWRLIPDGRLTNNEESMNLITKFTHSVTMRTFYSFGYSFAQKEYHNFHTDDLVVYPELAADRVDSYSFMTAGTDNNRFKRRTSTHLLKFDMTSQINDVHKIKFGAQARLHELQMDSYELRPPDEKTSIDAIFDDPIMYLPQIMDISTIYNSHYIHNPVEYSAYIQDKIELTELIINAGVRFDYFNPDGEVVTDPSDPSIYNPIKQENINTPLDDRFDYWYKDAKTKLQISPRFGASFPFTDKGIIHVSYGHFFQIPSFELLYRNPEFDLGSGTGNVGVIGNSNLKASKNVKGEIGLKQEIYSGMVLDVTAYFQDIRNLAGTRNALIDLAGGASNYNKIDNSDFAYVKGLVLTLNYSNPAGVFATLDYTFQIAEGTASDPEDARNAATGGALPEVFMVPLDWDQRHTVNLNGGFDSKSWGVNVVGNFGSGLPYTPIMSSDISTTLTNSQFKPYTVRFDLNTYYNTQFFGYNQQWFVRVKNLFDRLNVNTVYPRSGQADFTPEEARVEALELVQVINTVNQWFRNETYYQEPRRIEVGVTISF
ncbi:MAG: TonB-dependent receptor [Candidatus Marinimicrobia bacterium]|nr:TonB-dependent receptor [Candidatus Neomarinimicrobiota bacterium]